MVEIESRIHSKVGRRRSGAEMEVKSLTASVDGLLTWDSFVAMC